MEGRKGKCLSEGREGSLGEKGKGGRGSLGVEGQEGRGRREELKGLTWRARVVVNKFRRENIKRKREREKRRKNKVCENRTCRSAHVGVVSGRNRCLNTRGARGNF